MTKHDFLKTIMLEIADTTIAASISAHAFFGLGNEKAADEAAVNAMRRELSKLPISGRVVIGEGERDKAPMLYIGEELGIGGDSLDIAVDPLEGTTILAHGASGALSVIALAKSGHLLHAPDIYMDKIAIGFDFPERIIDLDNNVSQNLKNIAMAKKASVNDLSVIILNRPRHEELIAQTREAGARVILIDDGDIAAVVATAFGVDAYIGIGGAPEGVLAASALKTLGGQIATRLLVNNEDEKIRAKKAGIVDFGKQYYLDDLVKGDALFVATGVTDGWMLHGVRYANDKTITESIIMYSGDKSVRKISKNV